MEFTVYDVHSLSREDIQKWYDGHDVSFGAEPVETGLSAGEIRQSLMDRFRSAVSRGDMDAVSATTADYFGLSIEFDEDTDQVLHDIDELLYSARDDQLLGGWNFGSGYMILVVEGE